jgi:hypothetical protein
MYEMTTSKLLEIGLTITLLSTGCITSKVYIAENIGEYKISKIGAIIIWENDTKKDSYPGYHISITKDPNIKKLKVSSRSGSFYSSSNSKPLDINDPIPEMYIELPLRAGAISCGYSIPGFEVEISFDPNHTNMGFPGGIDDSLVKHVINDLSIKGYEIKNLSQYRSPEYMPRSMLKQIGNQHNVDAIYVLRYKAYSKFQLKDPSANISPYYVTPTHGEAAGLLLECNCSVYSGVNGRLLIKKKVGINSVEHLGIDRIKPIMIDNINGVIDNDLLINPLIAVLLNGLEGQVKPLHSGFPKVE